MCNTTVKYAHVKNINDIYVYICMHMKVMNLCVCTCVYVWCVQLQMCTLPTHW